MSVNQKKFTRDKGHYVLIKGLIQQENIPIMNIYISNNRPSKYRDQQN